MPASQTRHRIALAIALVGVVVSAYTLYVEHQLSTNPGFTSPVCNLGGVVRCDAVLMSRWGRLLDLPLPAWAIVIFVAGALLATPGALVGITGGIADWLLLGLVSGSLAFALVMAGIATFAIRAVCPMCITLYVVIVAWFVAVAPLAGGFETARVAWLRRPLAPRGMLAGAFVLSLVGGTLWASAPLDVTVDPAFASFYETLPVEPAASQLAEGGHVKGPAHAAVTIVEFSDFQCPACQQAFEDLRDLVRTRDDVRVVFRHFPLDRKCNDRVARSVHPVACLAACAAECAGDQGEFWTYHDRLFTDQSTLDRDSLFRHARELGLDLAVFRDCIDAPATLDRIREDVRRANTLDVGSTPTIFINGKRIEGALERAYYDYAIRIEQQAPPADG